MRPQKTPLLPERQAQRNLDIASSRKRIVINPNVMNALGHPTGYALLPGENTLLLAQPDSWVRKRAAFLRTVPSTITTSCCDVRPRGRIPIGAMGIFARNPALDLP